MTLTKNEHGRWEVRLRGPDGRIRSISTHQTDRDQAKKVIREAKIAQIETASEAGVLTQEVVQVLIGGNRFSVKEAIDPWERWMLLQHHSPNSIENAVMWVTAWATWAKVIHRKISSVTEEDIDPWINAPGRQKAGTRRQMLSAIRSFFRFVSAKGWMLANPAELVSVSMGDLLHDQKEVQKKPVFTNDEINLLLNLTKPDGERPSNFWHAAIAIARWTGLRLGDVACLEWSCLATGGKIIVWTQKRDKRVELPLEPVELAEAIGMVNQQDPQWMFPQARNIIRDPKRRSMLSMQFSKICDRCGIVGHSFHGLRATYITRCKEAGIPMPHIAQAVGHSDVSTTEGYLRED